MKINPGKHIVEIAKAAGLGKLFRRVYKLLQEPCLDASYISKNPGRLIGVFTDAYGNRNELFSGLRDCIKPDWRTMFCSSPTYVPPPSKTQLDKLKSYLDKLEHLRAFLELFSLSYADKEVVEIGTYDGTAAYALAQTAAKGIIATDMAAYYITQTPGCALNEETMAAKNRELDQLRVECGKCVDKRIAQRVSFVEDDICSSSLDSNSAEAAISWEVLEHVKNPADALCHIARILKPGGFGFHEYNPFFSVNGGHSLCTLDFLWGHARLQSGDFERYLREMRPFEAAVATSFYRNNLNRMTISELKQYIQRAGLSLIALIPWSSEQHLGLLSQEILKQCVQVYPSVDVLDLISPTVWVLFRKEK